jgi:hypothetical protein
VNQLEDGDNKEDQVVNEFPYVFPDELLPKTTPIAKRPYRMGVDELEKLKKQIKEL